MSKPKIQFLSRDEIEIIHNASLKVHEILATHKPEPIPEDVEREISQILKKAEAELK